MPAIAPFCTFEKIGAPRPVDAPVLGVVEHTVRQADPCLTEGHPLLAVHTATDTDQEFAEVWRARGPVRTGARDGIAFGHDGQHLFGAARIPSAGTYAEATERLYAAVFALVRAEGYPTVFRFWAYINHINAPNAEGLETYRDFCVGRARAVHANGVDPATMPAATGIGTHGGGIVCYFLAARDGTRVNLDNPRMATAHAYPADYGPRPPIFARATALGGRLYVSATASIRGHETAHRGDVAAQCRVALENIAAVIGRDNLARHGLSAGHTLADLDAVKVYVRHREDLEPVRRMCVAALSPAAGLGVLQTDIAREDLLVEIEAIVP
ncbi:FkbO/Hyg5 family chorismatase [Streptomyces sp. NBC_00878]|uniref:FkbO/Hyg5 family chorismatase n=1 Tax=Streptomyces sp. NBC_00878 TaxID=2975854 RepID=UPI002258B3D7|nr:FkbO/Hyg5 family chorismatase [Streptomyces sp. NBC_00878]MCX4911792.1 FkbO/Hyg5 family chorismatase [Streptomyces sp. NBC_00878]